MAKIEGVDDVVNALKKLSAEADDSNNPPSVVVGYTAAYALFVHENRERKLDGKARPSGLGVYWGPKGRPGFLLDVMREMTDKLREVVVQASKKGMPLVTALYLAGLRLQRESMLNVPVEYGFLRASAFTKAENGEVVGGDVNEVV